MYAFVNRYPLFFTAPRRPFRFDYADRSLSEELGLQPPRPYFQTPNGQIEAGVSKELLWERIFFLLSIEGLVPLSHMCKQMRHTSRGVVCSNEYSRIYEFDFGVCYYFGDDNISNLVQAHVPQAGDYVCYDYIAFHKGGKHEIDYIKTTDDFVGEIWFYSSDRIDGNTGVKDACVVSTVSSAQLLDADYSETMARFKMEKILLDNDMRGTTNGYASKGSPKYYRFKTSHIGRHKTQLSEPNWKETPQILAVTLSESELLQQLCESRAITPPILTCDYTLPA